MSNDVPHYRGDRGYDAFRILQLAFVVVPIIAGLDKFFNFLTFWPQYLSPQALEVLHGHDRAFMMIVGVIEIIAGILTIFIPKVFGYIIALWLLLIVINLLLTGHYYDIALRDVGLLLAAFSLGKLGQKYSS